MSIKVENVSNNVKVDADTNAITVTSISPNIEVESIENNVVVDSETNSIVITSFEPSIKVQSLGPQGKQGIDGVGVPTGGTARQVLAKIDGTNFNTLWRSNWYDYAMNVEYTGVDTITGSGTIKECTLSGDTIYRFINSTNNANGYPIEDSFYSDFSLTILLAQRGA